MNGNAKRNSWRKEIQDRKDFLDYPTIDLLSKCHFPTKIILQMQHQLARLIGILIWTILRQKSAT